MNSNKFFILNFKSLHIYIIKILVADYFFKIGTVKPPCGIRIIEGLSLLRIFFALSIASGTLLAGTNKTFSAKSAGREDTKMKVAFLVRRETAKALCKPISKF